MDKLAGEEKIKIVTEDVRYFQDAHGFLARPKKRGETAGVLLIHEYWGLNERIKDIAKELATEGYVVFAVDLYHGQVTSVPARAFKLLSSVDQVEAMNNMRAALEYLRKHEKAKRIASLGWFFGGGQSFQLAISGEKLNGTVIYYGDIETDRKMLKKIKWPILGIFAQMDEAIPVEKVKEFEVGLHALHIENEIYIYPGMGYTFEAWGRTLAFLNRNLKNYASRIKLKVKSNIV